MKLIRLYVIAPLAATVAFAVVYGYWQHERQEQESPNPRLVRDQTIGVNNACPIHHAEMKKMTVTIRYGFNSDKAWVLPKVRIAGGLEKFQDVRKSRFPFACDQAFGDCTISPSTPATAVIYVCSDCVRELAVWQNEKMANQSPQPTVGG